MLPGSVALSVPDETGAARSLYGSVMHRKDHAVPLAERHDVGPRLPARPLLREHEFAAGEVASRLREQHGDMQREDVIPVEALMQAVMVARPVLKQERRRLGLTGPMAPLEGTQSASTQTFRCQRSAVTPPRIG